MSGRRPGGRSPPNRERDQEWPLEVSALQEPHSLTQQSLRQGRRIKMTDHKLVVGSTLVRQLEHVWRTVKKLWVEAHRAMVRAAAAGN